MISPATYPDGPRPPAIEIRGLSKTFQSTTVLDAIDLVVEPGCVFGYIGPNGAGKSTTVKILVGMLAHTEGEVRVAGIDVAERPQEVKRHIGYVPENAVLYDSLTPFEHLRLVGRLRGMADAEIDARGEAILECFGIAARRHARIGALSKGMRQKLMITSALLHDPDILFLDEPLSGLDVYSTVLIKELIAALAKSGCTVFYCSHMMDVVERVCDRIAILSGGRIVANGSFAELLETSRARGTLERIFLELTGGGEAQKTAEAILDALGRRPAAAGGA